MGPFSLLLKAYILASAAGESMISASKCAYHLKKLRKGLARANDYAFLQMVWAADALQSGRDQAAAQYLTFPKEAADKSILSSYSVHRWELESLLIQLFLTPKKEIRPGPNLLLNCGTFDTLALTTNRLRQLEDVEAALYLPSQSIFVEMHRIGQRQFHWQRGYFNIPQFYRYAYIYNQGKCAEYFEGKYGLSIDDLMFVGFSLFATSQRVAWLPRGYNSPDIGLSAELVAKALPLLSLPLTEVREKTAAAVAEVTEKHGKPLPTAFLPSVVRQYPLMSTDENFDLLIAPIPELILLRVTGGLYYDLIGGGQALLNEANDRFEQYCAEYLSAVATRFAVTRSYQYGRKGLQVATPDLLVKDGGKLVIAAECKATKLTYLAQFADDPFEAEKKQYDQLATGVFQVWRFFSHIRRGLVEEVLGDAAYAMVITLDPFLSMSHELRDQVMERALSLAAEEPNILEEDRRPVIFCPIYDLEAIMRVGDEDSFLAALAATQEKRFSGWQLREVHRDCNKAKEKTPPRDFPFALDDLLPWWKRTRELAAGIKQAAVPSISVRGG